MPKGVCKNCNKKKDITQTGIAAWLCKVCYKKLLWKPKLVECKRCRRKKPMHAKSFCVGCYNSLFHLDNVKAHNAKRYHNIEPELYKKVTKNCVLCGFNNIVELHHMDHNKKNNSEDNLVGLCPNHHKMIHTKQWQKEVFQKLKEKGFKVPENGYQLDGFFKK